MRAVVQRVADASVSVGDEVTGAIDSGLLVYLGVGREDGREDVTWLAEKLAFLRIFEDENGKMNRSILEEGGRVLVISQFTLFADARKGRRPSYSDAAEPEMAKKLYDDFLTSLGGHGLEVRSGRFRAEMRVKSTNLGPVTILLDSKKSF